jgi:DNA-binding CsgD family transcriptional regulator
VRIWRPLALVAGPGGRARRDYTAGGRPCRLISRAVRPGRSRADRAPHRWGEAVFALLGEHRRLLDGAPDTTSTLPHRRFLDLLLDQVGDDDAATVVTPPPGLRSPKPAAGPLTKREQEVLRLLGDSMSNAEIARTTFVSPDTVKYHLKNIYAKIGARNRVDAARLARELGYSL